jgi:hypothetical protein
MLTGQLWLFNKTKSLVSGELHYTRSVALDITGTFNIEDNLNDTPSNAKFKTVTTNTYREEFEVNTIAYHQDTDSWWVIKSDESTYINTGEYEHEIQLVELLEFYSYKHLPNCAFAPNTYTLEQMLQRLFKIGKQDDIALSFPTFLDEDKIMPFMSFENYTIANAIKNIARSINAIPKLQAVVSFSSGLAIWKVDNFILTFVNRAGLDNTIVNTLNTQFPVAYEKNMNSSDQFLTRSVSNVTNAKSSNLVIAPLNGGFKNFVPNNLIFDATTRLNAKIVLPSKIDKVEFVNIIVPVSLYYWDGDTTTPGYTKFYSGYYTSKQPFIEALQNSGFFGTGQIFTNAQLQDAINKLPDPAEFYKVKYNQEVDKTFRVTNVATSFSVFHKKMTLLNKFEFDTVSKIVGGNTEVDTDKKDRTIHWTPFTNEIIMPLSFRNGLAQDDDHNIEYYLLGNSTDGTDAVYLVTDVFDFNVTNKTVIYNEDIMIQVGYFPIADIKVSIDNDNDAQDEKFYNQSGKVIDAVSVSKLITSHTNDSVEGTKIRNARYTALNQILPLGQIIRDSNQLYVISQRSIDANVRNGNEYYNVIYTLSRNRIARSENIIADSAVISYKTPDDNLVFRNQLYKDYIELSLQSIHNETPYLVLNKALSINSTLAGTDFDYTVLAKNDYGSTPTIARYVRNPTIFDLHKSKLMNVNWQDNNVIGFRFNRATGTTTNTLVQTPIVYTDGTGKATDFELLFCSTNDIIKAREYYNDNFTPTSDLIPFEDLTQVNEDFYQDSIIDENNFSFRIEEPLYSKDPFEIPVFEYMVQANDDYNALGNMVVGNDLFTNFNGAFHYVINNTTRFTAENASDLWEEPIDQFQNSFIVTRSGTYQEILDLDLYADGSLFPLGRNEALIKNIGFYVKNGSNIKFLFAINDYVESGSNDRDDIRVFINNWKI